jgi:hypothetical protein
VQQQLRNQNTAGKTNDQASAACGSGGVAIIQLRVKQHRSKRVPWIARKTKRTQRYVK